MLSLLIFLQTIVAFEIPNGFKKQPVNEFGKYIQANLVKGIRNFLSMMDVLIKSIPCKVKTGLIYMI
jgi:hypothetical protein